MIKRFKIISIFISLLLLFNITVSAKTIPLNEQIKNVINNYFNIQYKSIMKKDSKISEKLSKFINLKTETGKKIFDYEYGKSKYLIKSHKFDNTVIRNYKLNFQFKNISIHNKIAKINLILNKSINYNFLNDII